MYTRTHTTHVCVRRYSTLKLKVTTLHHTTVPESWAVARVLTCGVVHRVCKYTHARVLWARDNTATDGCGRYPRLVCDMCGVMC